MRVLAGIYHSCQPIHRGVWIRTAHRFDEGADGVEVVVAFLVIQYRAPLYRFFGDFQVD